MDCDAQRIVAHVDKLCRASWLRERRRRWPHFLYHHTSILNAVSILADRELCCRKEAEASGLIRVDSAHPDIIKATPWAHDYVRLYFRPQSPTHWHVEGIRPPERRHSSGAYCAVPVFFLFDSRRVLAMKQSLICPGTLADQENHDPTGDAGVLEAMDFEDVYHNSPLPRDAKRKHEIKFAMQAEVVVPGVLPLGYLRGIVCRSTAERDTLLHLLANDGVPRETLPTIKTEESRDNIFCHEWAYVTEVRLADGRVRVTQHVPDSRYSDPGDLYDKAIELTNLETGQSERYELRSVAAPSTTAPLPWKVREVEVRYWLAGDLAFHGRVRDVSLV